MAAKMLNNNVVKKLNSLLYLQQKNCSSSCNNTRFWKWDVSHIVSNQLSPRNKYAILILNRPILQSQDFLKYFWNNANVRITVDGGTLQWDKFLAKLPEASLKSIKLPDLVTGDFDSITDEILKKYQKKAISLQSLVDQDIRKFIVHTPDQNHTDFTKALMELNSFCQLNNIELDHVFAICQSSGRIDQILGNIQTLFLAMEKKLLSALTNLYLMSDDALSWLLCPGEHEINIPEEVRKHEKVWCSLVPIGEPCLSVTTTGLKWDLDNATLKYGDIVSTSNTYSGAQKVTIRCSHTILWSMEIPYLLDK